MDQTRILGFAGSLRRASYNRGLIRAAGELAPSGIVVEVFDLAEIPLYNQDVEDAGDRQQHRFVARALAQVGLSGKTRMLQATEEARDLTWDSSARPAIAAKAGHLTLITDGFQLVVPPDIRPRHLIK